jgi:hypothetical protein
MRGGTRSSGVSVRGSSRQTERVSKRANTAAMNRVRKKRGSTAAREMGERAREHRGEGNGLA